MWDAMTQKLIQIKKHATQVNYRRASASSLHYDCRQNLHCQIQQASNFCLAPLGLIR